MTDGTNQVVAAVLAAAKVAARGPDMSTEDYVAEYDAFMRHFATRASAAADKRSTAFLDARLEHERRGD